MGGGVAKSGHEIEIAAVDAGAKWGGGGRNHGGNAGDGRGTYVWRENQGTNANRVGGRGGGNEAYRVEENLGEAESHGVVGGLGSTGGAETPGVERTPR